MTIKEWCQKLNFLPGGEYLPYDWVEEGKLLLFIKDEVASRAPKRGSRLKEEQKRKAPASSLDCHKKRRKTANSIIDRQGMAMKEEGEVTQDSQPTEGDDDDAQSELVLMYNSVYDYVSAINEFWKHQILLKLHSVL